MAITPKSDPNLIRSEPVRAERDRGFEETREFEHADHDDHLHFLRRASWGAIFAGSAVAVVVQIMFTLLAISFGLALVDPRTESNPMNGVGVMVGVWTALGALGSVLLRPSAQRMQLM